jgi:formate dehydrogenase iron-sulfur subunit
MPITGFLTDSTVCIGCKACEVACKEWNQVPDDGFAWTGLSYDNTQALGHSTWRHVKFVERPAIDPAPDAGGTSRVFSWDFSSDVCKHCEHAGCLEACPTGAIVRTEFGGVFIQPDVCNGCGYCVVSCPFGVVDRRPDDGRAFKCTFCYDRQKAGLAPACATACPTQSIQFGELDDLRRRAEARLEELRARGVDDATIYDPRDSSVGGTHAIFIVRGDPRTYNLPPRPEVPTVHLRAGWGSAAIAAGGLLAGVALAFLGTRQKR